MKTIITVGMSPCWDVICSGERIDWGSHSVVSQERRVAGKAFNVSRALAWMGRSNIAAGLWGAADFMEMTAAVERFGEFIDVRFIRAAGKTRENITLIDKSRNREIHLRSAGQLAGIESLSGLKDDLGGIVTADSVCVFAGSLPGGDILDQAIGVIESVRDIGARIVVDTGGDALCRVVDLGGLEIIKPNLDELSELAGVQVEDNVEAIADYAGSLLDRVKTVFVSRGKKGAVVVNRSEVWSGRCISEHPVVSTVGCGDFLLGGFLFGNSIESGLAAGLKAAAARAWGWIEESSWQEAEGKIDLDLKLL